MHFTSRNSSFTNRFMGHLSRFIEQYNLFTKSDNLLVAVSGGIDSMVLLYAINQLESYGYSNKLRVLHINHGSREGQDREAIFVEEFCKHLGVECHIEEFSGLNPSSNFEYKARIKRYEALYDYAYKGEKIVLAHHIDDSFEWTLLQSLRSSSIEGLIGIPLVNNRVIRPFMCFTKKQITSYAQYFDLPFILDPTNEEMKYERNFIRQEVITAFKDRHPKYLKHYVYRHNEIARRLGMHLVNKNKTDYQLSIAKDSVLIYSLAQGDDFSGLSELVRKSMQILNPNSRGTLSKQLSNIVRAMKNNKVGPIVLTKSFCVYMDYHLLLITKRKSKRLSLAFDEFKTFSYEEFHNLVIDNIHLPKFHLDFPFIVVIKGNWLDRKNFKLSFNSDYLSSTAEDNIRHYPALRLLREWSKKRNRHKVLRLNYLTSL